MPDPIENEKLSFWVPRTLADPVRRKLLDHKIATRERKTITDICTEALKNYLTLEEGNEMAKTYYRVNIFGNDGASKSHHVYDDAETALRKAASERTDHNSAVVWEIKGSRHVCLVNYDGLDRIEAAAYIVYVGECGNELGHYVGASDTLTGAKQIAGRELSDYAGDGWSKITNDKTGERYSREGNASWVGPF